MAENSDNIASIEAARAAANGRADKLHGASEDLIAAEGRRVDAEIEATARLLCTATGADPDDWMGGETKRKHWEDWIDDARMMLSPAGPETASPHGIRFENVEVTLRTPEDGDPGEGEPEPTLEDPCLHAQIAPNGDGSSKRFSPDEYFFPGEKDEPNGIAPESLEQMHEADVETALIQRALAAEDRVRRVEADLQMEQARFDALERQLTFALAALTRQFERVAGLRLFCGDIRAEQVVPFVQAEVDAVNATLTAIENRGAGK